MAFSHKPFTRVAFYDPTASPPVDGTDFMTTDEPREAFQPDIAAPTEYFYGGTGLRSTVRAGTVFSAEVADQTEIAEMRVLDGTVVQAIALGPSRSLQWYESVPLEVRAGNLPYDSVRGELYSGKLNPGIYSNADLLLYNGFLDAGSNGIIDGWSTGGANYDAGSSSMSGDTFTMAATDGGGTGDAITYIDVVLPFSSVTLTASCEIVALYTGTSATELLELQLVNAAGTAYSTASTVISSTGTKTVSITTGATTWKVRVRLQLENITGAGNWQFKAPSLTFSV